MPMYACGGVLMGASVIFSLISTASREKTGEGGERQANWLYSGTISALAFSLSK